MFSNDRNIETIGQLVEVLKHYIELQKESMKLDVVEKIVHLITASSCVGTVAAFSIVGCCYLSMLILCVIFRHQWIERPLVRFLAQLFFSK